MFTLLFFHSKFHGLIHNLGVCRAAQFTEIGRRGFGKERGKFDVVRVDAGKLNAADGRVVKLDEILWCTAATGPAWPEAAGLSVDHRGFVSTNALLQSISHDFIFATGDIGTQVETPSAKAGVYAVRQAPYLYENIRRYILGDALKPYRAQKDFLSLMATGGKRAIASRGPLAFEGDWIWSVIEDELSFAGVSDADVLR